MDINTELLVRILATTDGLFSPVRWKQTPAKSIVSIVERQHRFRRGGLAMPGGGDAGDRQEHGRDIAALADAGMLRTWSGAAKRNGVRLTPQGDTYVRTITAAYRIDESWLWLELLGTWPPTWTNAGFALETDIIGTSYSQVTAPELADLENQMLPLLAAGLIVAAGDLQNAVGYRCTPRGLRALAAGPPIPGDLPAYDETLAESYSVSFADVLRDRQNWKPDIPGHVAIPLGAGSWRGKPEGAVNV